jgi:hypothetical protein
MEIEDTKMDLDEIKTIINSINASHVMMPRYGNVDENESGYQSECFKSCPTQCYDGCSSCNDGCPTACSNGCTGGKQNG